MPNAAHQTPDALLRYQALFDFAPVGYLVTDKLGIIEDINYAAAAMLGGRKQFLVGRPLLFFVASSDRREFSVNLNEVTSAGGLKQWTMKLHPVQADTLYVIVTAAAADVVGQPNSVRWTFRDITRQYRAEERLRAEQDFLNNLIELAEAVIVVLDPAGRILRANNYLYGLTGQEPGDLAGVQLTDLMHPEDQAVFQDELLDLGLGLPRGHGLFRLYSKAETFCTIAWSARNLMPYADRDAKTLLVGNDITELQKSQHRAVEMERLAAIGEMSAGLAHESRNALQRSMASLGLLAFRVQDQPELMTLVERIQKAQDDLQRLYESVREYAAPVKLQEEYCDLAGLWREAWENLAVARKGREAELYEEIRTCNLHCEGSPLHMRQVFRNLLENALTASDQPLLITIRCTDADIDGRDAVEIAVADNGPGFSVEGREKAFQLFFTTKVRGTGLGLSICKRLVEAHGGRIALGQPHGHGALVSVTLPRRRDYETADATATNRGG